MSTPYDCTADVQAHQATVRNFLAVMEVELAMRAARHDESKLLPPEKETFDRWKPVIEREVLGTADYDAARRAMGEGLQAHYRSNRHHPEHFPNGINGMTLIDVIEMFCDWMAVATSKGTPLNWAYLSERFSIGSQLLHILQNTAAEWAADKSAERATP